MGASCLSGVPALLLLIGGLVTIKGFPFSSNLNRQLQRSQRNERREPLPRSACLLGSTKVDQSRDVRTLNDWAFLNGVQLMPGVELGQYIGTREWGVTISQTLSNSNSQRPPVMSIPPSLILSSASIQNLVIDPALANFGMEHYVPEFCLFWMLLREHIKGERSRWHPWIQSLPRTIDTAIYFDETEQAYARQLGASNFLDHQNAQWQAFQRCLPTVFPSHRFPTELQKWAYSIVLTRSWRTSFLTRRGEAVANLVPMGDMFNHRATATVQVKQETAEDSVFVVLKYTSSTNLEGLFLNYGYPQHPDRFLMVFGFCDTSSPIVCANSILELFENDEDAATMGFYDSSQIVFYTKDGRPSETLENAVLYKLLQRQIASNPEDERLLLDMKILQKSCLVMENPKDHPHLKELRQRYRMNVVDFLRHQVEDILSGQFGPIPHFNAHDYSSHPRLKLMVQYHEYMRSVYERIHHRLLQ